MNQLTTVNGGARIHDADGNLTDDGSKLFVWDAENRLVEIKLKSDNSTVATYAYDYASRRITKTVGATGTNFVYDGWNPIAEFTGSTLSKTYTWGLDLSGSTQGAGGVGALLAVHKGLLNYYPLYDGNGNVSEYINDDGVIVAHYEYDSFGNQVVKNGVESDLFNHRFSSKIYDSESGLYYYGYRYYCSKVGSWLSRDPLREQMDLNIFGFVNNNPLSHIDYLGLWSFGGILKGAAKVALGVVAVAVVAVSAPVTVPAAIIAAVVVTAGVAATARGVAEIAEEFDPSVDAESIPEGPFELTGLVADGALGNEGDEIRGVGEVIDTCIDVKDGAQWIGGKFVGGATKLCEGLCP